MQAGVEGIDRDQNENQPRHRIEDIDDTHHQGIDPATGIASDEPPSSSDEEAHERTAEPNEERNAPSGENSVEDIAAVEVSSEGVVPGGGCVLIQTGLAEGRG